MIRKTKNQFLLFLSMIFFFTSVHGAELGQVEYSGSGFLTLAAGKMLSGSRTVVIDRNCPCFIADYAQGAVYDGRSGFQLGPDSKLGLQGTAKLKDVPLSVITQALARGADGGRIDLEWLYVNYQFSDSTTIQIGRMRLPLFYYSDIQDVGFALPWIHLPPQMYGWEATNYNGVNFLKRMRLGGWATTISVLAGNENISDSGYWKIYSGQQTRTSVKWKNIIGGNVMFAKDWFETRLTYIQSETSRIESSSTDPFMLGKVTRQNIYSAAFNIDINDWLGRSEILYIDHPGWTFRDHAWLLGAGRRFGRWQLLATVSDYRSEAIVEMGADPLGQESHVDRSLVLRYDLTDNSDFKAQLDSQKDRGGINWSPRMGDALLLSLAYDRVF